MSQLEKPEHWLDIWWYNELVKFLGMVQFSSVAQSCPTLCDPVNRSTPGFPVHHQLTSSLRLVPIESVMPSSHLILCRPFLLPPIPPSIRVLSNESTLHMRWPKYWSFSFSISHYPLSILSPQVFDNFPYLFLLHCCRCWSHHLQFGALQCYMINLLAF